MGHGLSPFPLTGKGRTVGSFCWRGQSSQICDLRRDQGAIRAVTRMQAQRKGPCVLGTPGVKGHQVPWCGRGWQVRHPVSDRGVVCPFPCSQTRLLCSVAATQHTAPHGIFASDALGPASWGARRQFQGTGATLALSLGRCLPGTRWGLPGAGPPTLLLPAGTTGASCLPGRAESGVPRPTGGALAVGDKGTGRPGRVQWL